MASYRPSSFRSSFQQGTRSRWCSYEGFFFDSLSTDSAWIREVGILRLPPLDQPLMLRICGRFEPAPTEGTGRLDYPGLMIRVPGSNVSSCVPAPPQGGDWETTIAVPQGSPSRPPEILFQLTGVAWTNAFAWMGRVSGIPFLQRFRAQDLNRRLRISTIGTVGGEVIVDFGNRQSPFVPEFTRRHLRLGINIAGFLTADLGVGESARCMVRAADAVALPTALINLRLHCKNPIGDMTYASRLVADPVHPVNIVHVDPPASLDIEHHHGRRFRTDHYNIGYWAWELPDFPDAWMRAFDCFDEIWCPSEFVRAAISLKSPIPVLSMPHAIAFARPLDSMPVLRNRLGLPADRFLFLFIFDLNSYAERKNPQAVVEAFRRSGLQHEGCRLVLKVHNVAGNEADLASLRLSLDDLPGSVVITRTLDRSEVYALEAACDCFVSLHRSEGFGLALAECMYLGKPVIATDWSATTEFLDADCGLPVRAGLVTLDRSHGPYSKGQSWAAPDIDHAVAQMRRIRNDGKLRSDIGSSAKQRIESRFAPALIGERYRRRLEAIAMR
ncbi:MAG: glycosyltransferase family 4 protein [Opitutaceae bacterium]|nr:glycosyltransferase family 4 protein [Opitutaceae bacterium]